MADSTPISYFVFFSSLLLILPSSTVTDATITTSAAACKDTLYPSFCQKSLLINNATATLHDYARFAIRKSIATATKFSDSIDNHLTAKKSTPVNATEIRALQDCRYLARLNVDFLSATYQKVNTGQTSLPAAASEHAQTMLSAVLTNTQTCIDGLQTNAATWTSQNDIVLPIQNNDKLYSISLALFNKAFGRKRTRFGFFNNKQTGFLNGRFPRSIISEKPAAVFEAAVGRQKVVQVGGGGDEVVVSDVVVVSQDGSGNFTTISDAVDFAPKNSASGNGYFLINVTAGVYEEYVNIPKNKKYLMMIGAGINQTVVTGNHSVGDGWTTFKSGTFIVVAPNFVAVNITIRNTAGPTKGQAVALRNGADFSTFYRCSFEGYQDTLYTHSLRQFYRECDIYGTVDFIFGNAAVVFQNCNIYPRLPKRGQFNAITAQGRRDPGQNTGTSIQKCSIREADDLASGDGTTVTYLGRPWREFSRTVYMQSFMDRLISPAGWLKWSSDEALNTLYYAEFNNSGPGSDTSERVSWSGFHVIDATDAAKFTASALIPGDAFLPPTGVPYDSGL